MVKYGENLFLACGKLKGFQNGKGRVFRRFTAIAGRAVVIGSAMGTKSFAGITAQGGKGQRHDDLLCNFGFKVKDISCTRNKIHFPGGKFNVICVVSGS